MALSTLTTYQHHFIDLPTGLWVGLFSMVLFPADAPEPFGTITRPAAFPTGGGLHGGRGNLRDRAWLNGGLAWLLLWPAAALAVAAASTWTGRPEWFRKSERGAMMPATISAIAPYRAGSMAQLALVHARSAPAQEIASAVWLGRIPRRAEREALSFVSVVDLTAELPFTSDGIAYRWILMLDLLTPATDQLEEAVKAIQALEPARPTLVCCALGYSRSAAAVAAWLIATGKAQSTGQAVEFIRARRPSIVMPPPYRALLEQWAGTRANR